MEGSELIETKVSPTISIFAILTFYFETFVMWELWGVDFLFLWGQGTVLWATSCSAQESTVLRLCLDPDSYRMLSMYSLKGWAGYTVSNCAQGFFLKGFVDLTGCWRLNLPAKHYLSGLYSSPWGYLLGPHCHYLLLLLLGVGGHQVAVGPHLIVSGSAELCVWDSLTVVLWEPCSAGAQCQVSHM